MPTFRCARCGYTTTSTNLPEDWIEAKGLNYCENCWVECEVCGERVMRGDAYSVRNQDDEATYVCLDCMPAWTDYYDEDGGEYRLRSEPKNIPPTKKLEIEIRHCQDCRETDCGKCPKHMRLYAKAMEEERRQLWVTDVTRGGYHDCGHSHHKATPLLAEHENPYLLYGIEREFVFNTEEDINEITKKYIEATKGLFVAEYDRSVSDIGNGAEFISRPTSFAKWNELEDILMNGEEVLERYNVREVRGCGLHVHISKKFFKAVKDKDYNDILSDLDWIFQFFQPEIEALSQRPYTDYCMSKKARINRMILQNRLGFNLEGLRLGRGNLTRSSGSGDTHHDAIIETDKTVEIRTFKSLAKTKDILAILEFVRSVAHFVRDEKDVEGKYFSDIIFYKESPHLRKYVAKHRINTERKLETTLEVL